MIMWLRGKENLEESLGREIWEAENIIGDEVEERWKRRRRLKGNGGEEKP